MVPLMKLKVCMFSIKPDEYNIYRLCCARMQINKDAPEAANDFSTQNVYFKPTF